MKVKGRISLVVDPQDSMYWDGQMQYLRENGWEVVMFKHQSWIQPDSTSPLPDGAKDSDVLLVYGLGEQNWWVEALTALNRPTVYVTSIGSPELKLDKLVILSVAFRFGELLAAIEKVAA